MTQAKPERVFGDQVPVSEIDELVASIKEVLDNLVAESKSVCEEKQQEIFTIIQSVADRLP
jgi:hypothetical protein